MYKYRNKRNWSDYNQKLKTIARIEFFISEEAIQDWFYNGKQKPGGKVLYSDHAIECCLLMREFYQLSYRQTQGFVESVFFSLQLEVKIPDYTTISRRAARLILSLCHKGLTQRTKEAIVVAIDSTGLSLYTHTEWTGKKHQQNKMPGHEKWRKLPVAINVKTGEILDTKYTQSTANDGPQLPAMLNSIPEEIAAVCGDMAYDTMNCRKAIQLKKARQLIPPIRQARLAKNNRNIAKKHHEILYERDQAIRYIQHNTINGNASLSRQSWKEKRRYHARSLVETTMGQIKSHSSDYLSNKLEQTRATQAKIKCKIVNLVNAA